MSVSQGVMGMKAGAMAAMRKITPDKVRMLTGNVGGSFGMKARGLSGIRLHRCTRRSALGRPVKWTDERSGSFMSDSHGRDHEHDRRAGARRRGTFPRGAASPASATLGGFLGQMSDRMPPTLNTVQERASASIARR